VLGSETRCRKGDGDRGFVLVAVLLVALVLILVAVTFTHGVRSRVRTVASSVGSAQAEALADAGVHLALLELEGARRPREPRFAVGGAAAACAAPGGAGVIAVQVQDEAGKINLNSNNEGLLLALLVGLGAPVEEARPMVQRILDFRDGDSQRRPDGAEAEDYAAVSAAPPKNRPFDAVEELEQVLNVPAELVLRARPFLTVNSDADGFDPRQSPPGLREVIAKGAVLMSDTGFAQPSGAMGQLEGIPRSFVSGSEMRAVTILATGQTPSGARFTRQAVLEAPLNGRGGFTIRRWLQSSTSVPAQYGGDMPQC
jgi:general secretion pathway protein K